VGSIDPTEVYLAPPMATTGNINQKMSFNGWRGVLGGGSGDGVCDVEVGLEDNKSIVM
jgi:hypothetical protein